MLIFDQLNRSDPHLRALTLAVLTAMSILLAGLWYVQVVSANRYQSNVKNQSFRTVRMPAPRGKILDRDGVALAENRPAYNVSLYLHELRDQFREEWRRSQPPAKITRRRVSFFGVKLFEWNQTRPARRLTRSERTNLEAQLRYRVASNIVAQLSTQLVLPVSLDPEKFHRHYTSQLALPLTLVSKLDSLHIARFHENSMGVPGVDLDAQPIRVYPFGPFAAQTLGHLRRDDSSPEDEATFFNYRLPDYKGAFGIEALFNKELAGKPGIKSVLVNSSGYRQSERELLAVEPGKNIVLTLARPIQQIAEGALASGPRGTNTRGAVVVMDVNSGDILAMASSPSFNPNDFVPRLLADQADRLNDSELRPTFNRATYGAYAPGSIFKVITGLAALEAGVLNPNEEIDNPGYYPLGKGIRDLAPPGKYDFKRAFKKSSNFYFITYGLKAGEDAILGLSKRVHLGESTGILPGQEISGVLPTREWRKKNRLPWYDGDTANLSFGQGYLSVTPIQMTVMVSAVANGGKVFWPRLVDRIEPQSIGGGEPIRFPAAHLRDQLSVSNKNLEVVRAAMLADVEEEGGTGRPASVPGLRVCGKTGTAQVKQGSETIDTITWFASFAPYESPRYAVVVMVESGASGGGTCAPMAAKVYRVLQTWEKSYPLKADAVAAK